MMLLLGAHSLIPLVDPKAEASLIESSHTGKLSFHNEHTGESLNIQYLDNGSFDKDACQELDRFFRCHYDGRMRPIDPRLFLLLDTVRCRLGATSKTYRLLSGYRSPAYNRLLCREESGVAHNSYHMKGMAADICIEGVRLHDVEKVARRLRIGGVGKYSNFVHLDVGPVRTW